MTFPSTSGTVQQDCAIAWNRARAVAGVIKDRATSLKGFSAAGTLTSSQVLDFGTFLADARAVLAQCAGVQGIAAYAQAQINDNTINIATEFLAMTGAADNVAAWLIANFPKTATTNELRAKTWSPDNSGRTVDVVFTAANTAGLRTNLDALIATIN